MLTLANMVLAIPVWYLHPPEMVPQPSLPPKTEGILMHIPVITPTTQPPPPLVSTTAIVEGQRKKKEPTALLPPRVQLPFTTMRERRTPHQLMSLSPRVTQFNLTSLRNHTARHYIQCA
jgi:hypothetical protein